MYIYVHVYYVYMMQMFSWSPCLACSRTIEVEAGQLASDRDAVANPTS